MRFIRINSRHSLLKLIILSTLLSFNPLLSQVKDIKTESNNPLYVDPTAQDFSRNPDLLERIIASPHGYFRFINIPFSNEVCRRFKNSMTNAPALNLHGDAHLEQYAITDLGRGLTDYDDSSTGPGIIDLMRFGVSLNLACRDKNWDELDGKLFDKLLLGYRNALENLKISAPEPTIVKKIQSYFTINREKYFEWIDSIMDTMPNSERDSVIAAMQPYVQTMFVEDPELNKDFFNIVQMGYLHMGIGSALDLKYLVRIHGRTDDSMDDFVLEVKEVRNLGGIECIQSGQMADPFRIIRGQARIAYQPFHYLGYFRFRNLNFWVHSWVDNYKEATIGKTFQSPNELGEVAYDIGVQLGRGHVKYIADPFDLQLRREQLQLINQYEDEIKKEKEELARLTILAWEKFCHYFEDQPNN